MRIMEIEASVTMLQNFWVKVPDDMPDEAVLAAIKTALDVDAEIIDTAASEDRSRVTHEVRPDGDVELLDDAFEFPWEVDRF